MGVHHVEGPLANEQHGPTCCVQRLGHLRAHRLGPERVDEAAVELEGVDRPVCEGSRVQLEVAGAGRRQLGRIAGAGLGAAVAIDAQLQVEPVDVVGQVLDAPCEAAPVGHQPAHGVALELRPAVVDVDVAVAEQLPVALDQRLGHLEEEVAVDAILGVLCAVDLTSEPLPGHPAHGRGFGEAVVEGRGEGGECK